MEDEALTEASSSERRLRQPIDLHGRYTSRRYAGQEIPNNKRTDVTIVFGLRAAGSTPLVGAPTEQWSFDPSFEPDNPWSQRAIYAACVNVPTELQVITTNCWVNLFRVWLVGRGDRFPSRKFDDDVISFFRSSTGKIKGPENIWMVDRKVKASKISFAANFRSDAGASQGLKYMKKWDEYLDSMNSASSISANRAWHTAALFVRAEAEVAVIDSTVETIVISAVCGWIGMLAFTKDPWTAGLVTSLVLGIISGLAFFMVVVMGWKIGPIEVISLVVFVGYSVTYSLHIAHNYIEVPPDDTVLIQLEKEYRAKEHRRKNRKEHATEDDVELPGDTLSSREVRRAKARMAVLHIGGATLSSSISTLGSSFFLLFCTMNIFVKLGSVVIAVTLLSITFALVPLPALLMAVGPEDEPACSRYARCIRRGATGGFSAPIAEGTLDDPNQPLVVTGREVHSKGAENSTEFA